MYAGLSNGAKLSRIALKVKYFRVTVNLLLLLYHLLIPLLWLPCLSYTSGFSSNCTRALTLSQLWVAVISSQPCCLLMMIRVTQGMDWRSDVSLISLPRWHSVHKVQLRTVLQCKASSRNPPLLFVCSKHAKPSRGGRNDWCGGWGGPLVSSRWFISASSAAPSSTKHVVWLYSPPDDPPLSSPLSSAGLTGWRNSCFL